MAYLTNLYNVLYLVTIFYNLTVAEIASCSPSTPSPYMILAAPFNVNLPPLGSETENFRDVNYYKNRTIYR